MKLLPRMIVLVIPVFCWQPPASLAAEPAILSAIPQDTLAVLTIRDLSTLDGKVGKLATEFGFGPISLLWLVKGQLQIVDGIDERGTAAVLLVPATEAPTTRREIVLFVPTLDREKMLVFLQPEPIEEGYSKVKLKGKDAYVGTKGAFSVFGPSLESVKSVVEADSGIAVELSAHQKKQFGVNDLSVIVNVKSLSSHSGFDDLKQLMAAFGLGERELKDRKTWQFSARLDDAGIVVEIYTEKTQAERVATPAGIADPLLAGLPREGFVWAMGMTGAEGESRATSITGAILDYLDRRGALDASRKGDLEEAIHKMAAHAVRVSSVVSALPEGPGGLVGLTKIVETNDDPRRLLSAVENLVAMAKSGLFTDPEFSAALERITYRKGAEKSGDVLIDHLVMDVSNLKGYDEAGIKRAFGRDGLLVRYGAVDDKHLVICIGGGLKRFEEVAALVRSRAAPLAGDELIVRGAQALPPGRTLETHVALDRLADLAKRLARAMDIAVPFVTVVKLDAPLSIAVHPVGPAAWQVDIIVPRPVVIASAKALVELVASQIGSGRGSVP